MRGTIWMGLLLLTALAFSALGCGDPSLDKQQAELPEGAPMLDGERWLGQPLVASNLTVWPVYSNHQLDIGEFVTLEEAESQGKAVVREVGGQGGEQQRAQSLSPGQVRGDPAPMPPPAPSDAPKQKEPQQEEQERIVEETVQEIERRLGNDLELVDLEGEGIGGATVGTLVIENKGDLPILVVAGTIVKGGQQDRQIGQDFVIAANTTAPVEAFCVEQGRWHSLQAGDAGQRLSNTNLGLAVKGVRNKAQYEKNQGAVWNEVSKTLSKSGVTQTTSLVAAVEKEDEALVKERDSLEAQVRAHFDALSKTAQQPIGFAYAVNGKIETVRAFAHPRLLADHLPAFSRAMAFESILAKDGERRAVQADDVISFVHEINRAQEELAQTRAMNINGIRMAQDGYNGNCYVTLPELGPDKVILTSDWTSK